MNTAEVVSSCYDPPVSCCICRPFFAMQVIHAFMMLFCTVDVVDVRFSYSVSPITCFVIHLTTA